MAIKPEVPGFFLHDFVQVVIGATLLAIPVGFTQEVWNFSAELPAWNVFGIFLVSVIFIGIFTYYHYHSINVEKHWNTFTKRVCLTYITSFVVVFILMLLIDKFSFADLFVSFKRVVIVTLPASMSAAIADKIR